MKKKIIGILIISIMIFGGIFYFVPQKESKIDEELVMLTNEKVNIIIETKGMGIDYQDMQYSYNIEDFYACKHFNKITCTIPSNQIEVLAKEDWVKRIYKDDELISIDDIEDSYTSVQWTDEERKQFLITPKELKEMLNAKGREFGDHIVKIGYLRDSMLWKLTSSYSSRVNVRKYIGTLDATHPAFDNFRVGDGSQEVNIIREIFGPLYRKDERLHPTPIADIRGGQTFGLSLLVGSGSKMETDKWDYEEALGYVPTEEDFQGLLYPAEGKIKWYSLEMDGFGACMYEMGDFVIEEGLDILINPCWCHIHGSLENFYQQIIDSGTIVISFPQIVGNDDSFWQPAQMSDVLVAGTVRKDLKFERIAYSDNLRPIDCVIPTYMCIGANVNSRCTTNSAMNAYRDSIEDYYSFYFSDPLDGRPDEWIEPESYYCAFYGIHRWSQYILAAYVAYLKSYDQDITVDEIRDTLKENCVKLEGIPEFEQGYGLLQFKKSGIEGITDVSTPIGLILVIGSILSIALIGIFIQVIRRKYYV